LARGSDEGETIRALLALGSHLEVCDADYSAARDAYREALELAEQVGDLPSQVELHVALALLAAYAADWDAVRESGEAGVELAEGEGLVGKLCYPYALRGLLRWREGDWEGSAEYFRRAHELADQIGLSEIAFSSLFGLSLTLRDAGDYTAAAEALDQALDVCERAGLVAQSIQAISGRALVLLLQGDEDAARQAAAEAQGLAERLHYPVGRAAALEAVGATAGDPGGGVLALDEARAMWNELGRPLEATRCTWFMARLLAESDPDAAAKAEEEAVSESERLGAPHALRSMREAAAG
jgi:tetratricopeptide (TPR) repeat protein